MQFEIIIQCDNAAFKDDIGAEIGKILWTLKRKVESQAFKDVCIGDSIKLQDSNGNTVGYARLVA